MFIATLLLVDSFANVTYVSLAATRERFERSGVVRTRDVPHAGHAYGIGKHFRSTASAFGGHGIQGEQA